MKLNQFFSKSNNLGKTIILIGILMLVPLFILPFYSGEIKYTSSFLIPSFGSVLLGLALSFLLKPEEKETELNARILKGNLTVLLTWLYGFLAGALPFVISGQLNFIQALFESVSGWTTTGLSVIDVTVTPNIFLFHRSFMQFCGGLGFIMVMMIFIQSKQSMNLYNAEGHPDKLMPNLKKTARTIMLIFLVFLSGGTILYIICGMSPFESLIHAMSALSTGGFSTRANSIGEYNSVAIEAVTIVLMILGSMNFAVLLLMAKGKIKETLRVSEVRFLFLLLAIFVPLMALSVYGVYLNAGESFRIAFFNSVSALTGTGYSTASYTNWPPLAFGIIIILMITGGGIGSTSGGLKLSRVYLLLRATGNNIKKRLSTSRRVMVLSYYKAQGKVPIDEELFLNTLGFIAVYIIIYIIGTLLFTLTAACSLSEAMFEFASALGTVGLSLGFTDAHTNNATLILEMAGMILGRLEIFIVIIGAYCGLSMLKRGFLRLFDKG
jgi:trk system potassium uptake protein TrkH